MKKLAWVLLLFFLTIQVLMPSTRGPADSWIVRKSGSGNSVTLDPSAANITINQDVQKGASVVYNSLTSNAGSDLGIDAASSYAVTIGGTNATVVNIGHGTVPTELVSGLVTTGTSRYMHKTGTTSFFAGVNAGTTGNSGTANTGIGNGSLTSLTSGTYNTSTGCSALNSISTGSNNVCVGYNAGSSYTSGDSNNICIGSSVTGSAGASNEIRIGNGSSVCYIDGIYGVTALLGASVLVTSSGKLGTILSSRRYKENIRLLIPDNRIMRLRPVAFNYKADDKKITQYGLIAEEVEALYPELVIYGKDGQVESVRYYELDALLLSEVQELHRQINLLQAMLTKILHLSNYR